MSLSQSEQHLLEFINLDSSLQELVSEHHSVKRDIHVVATSRRTQMTCNVRSTVACQTAFDIKEEVLLSATKTITLQFLLLSGNSAKPSQDPGSMILFDNATPCQHDGVSLIDLH